MSVGASGTPPAETAVPVTAEWALWGKDVRDLEYRLLACSEGNVGAATFVEQITSISPGSAGSWPQVTVSGFLLSGTASYVALAIHDTTQGRHDAVGRGIVYTRYFCVPYPELAAGRVTYRDMYDAFSPFWPELADRSSQRFVLTRAGQRTRVPLLAPTQQTLARRVAALLLTSQGVCVLGADGVGTRERLAFLDGVMELLPYGMRSGLSGATWASSTAYDLKLRLFFADARRRGNDHMVFWHQPEHGPIDHPYADQYLHWLTAGVAEPEKRLAAVTEPIGFGPREVAMMLERLDVSYVKPPSRAVALTAHDPAEPVVAVLRECGDRLRGGNPSFIATELERLRGCLAFRTSPEAREYFRQVIEFEGLFQPHRSINKHRQDELYQLLLELAFETPLNYHSYCQVEACLGGQPHKQLLQAMQPSRLRDLRARMLVTRALGGGELKRLRAELAATPDLLLAAVADKDVRLDHARLLCELAIPLLGDCSDLVMLRRALQAHAYLAPTLRRLYQPDAQRQYDWLCQVLRAAHGGHIDRRDIPAILGHPSQIPSVALYAAVVELADPADVPVAGYEFLATVIGTANLAPRTKEWLLRTLPPPARDDEVKRRGPRKGPRVPVLDRIQIRPNWHKRESQLPGSGAKPPEDRDQGGIFRCCAGWVCDTNVGIPHPASL
jgi:hypothetical protein